MAIPIIYMAIYLPYIIPILLFDNGFLIVFLYVYQRVNLHFPMIFLWFSH